MAVFRRRLVFWLFKAYLKRWSKTIFFCFILGLLAFFSLYYTLTYFSPKIPLGEKEYIGVVGDYKVTNLPSFIMADISHGLTHISSEGMPKPAVATSWEVTGNGNRFIFHISKNRFFTDGSRLTTRDISYNFSDATITRPDAYTIVFTLNEPHSPFLVTAASKPILKNGLIGVGEYSVQDIELNGNFIQSLTLRSVKNRYKTKNYHFYPTEEALKIAFMLGEITKAAVVSDTTFMNTSLTRYRNVSVEKHINYEKLVTLFFNTRDSLLSDDKVRNALSYAVPDIFSLGVRNTLPYPPQLWTYAQEYAEKQQDLTHAQTLLEESSAKDSKPQLTIKTLDKYKKTAEETADAWKKLGFTTKIEIVDERPVDFQIFIGDFIVPKDPDQYALWHSDQYTNITRYRNLRIDKLLEDGRKTRAIDQRKKIYSDFQKYLLADSPAIFLYFPYEYTITRK